MTSTLSRRSFTTGVLAFAFAPRIGVAQQTPTPSAGADDSKLVAEVGGVTMAEQIVYSNIKRDSLFTEPIALFFTNYHFDNEQDAEEGFEVIAAHIDAHLADLAEGEYQKEVSIGRVGDDRIAFYVEESAPILSAAVRSENQVLTILSMSLGGNPAEFVGTFLQEFVPIAAEEDRSLLPELADLPLGWEASRSADDVTENTRPSTPSSTPRA